MRMSPCYTGRAAHWGLQVLLSRFFLDLSEERTRSDDGGEASPSVSQLSDLRFTRVVGSLVASASYDREGDAPWEATDSDMYDTATSEDRD